MSDIKLLSGRKAIVTAFESGHGFEIGDVVVLKYDEECQYNTDLSIKGIKGRVEYYLNETEYRLIEDVDDSFLSGSIAALVYRCHKASKDGGWYTNLQTGEPLIRDELNMLCLVHSEISEAVEGVRKDLMDDHLPNRKMAEVELADAVIRICDYAGYKGFDLGDAILEKLAYNAKRADHKIENRVKDGGKKW